ncbi:hypothetical protein CMV_004870 [Castanea mollissima]|uniref:Uncharacterized protein n=1 Tax=Castanea mollissima TaxID=60419 RepID=A0A8J4RY58_9ROSI|nr:hypothetical protein CMV_004870 [Castanea mollissima]
MFCQQPPTVAYDLHRQPWTHIKTNPHLPPHHHPTATQVPPIDLISKHCCGLRIYTCCWEAKITPYSSAKFTQCVESISYRYYLFYGTPLYNEICRG